ncbi:MAG: NTP transferase domain-containing protein [Desulfobacterales bacterium]|nr:NTP transferase domain-containing protein [Desulfobacterales bacterium]
MRSPQFAAVILSAGFSSRMGAFKPLLRLGERTLLEHVIGTVRSDGIEEIRVVLGHRAEELAPVVENAGATAVTNPDFEQGMFSSVCAGVGSLSRKTEAFFLLPVDIALVRPATLRRLAHAWQRASGRIVHPVFGGERGHPPLIPADLAPVILESEGQGGLRAVLKGHEKRSLQVAVPDENILFDVDRPEDYQEAKRRFARLSDPSLAECEAILSEVCPTDEKIIRHGRQVRQAAAAFCRALNRKGAGLDQHRVEGAALLHDVAKGNTDHAGVGARMLAAMGFGGVGAIVAAHTDLPEAEMNDPKEAAVVYLADKLVSRGRFVSLESRFDAALARYGRDRDARASIERRRSAALAVKRKIEEIAGLSVEKILAEAEDGLDGEKR